VTDSGDGHLIITGVGSHDIELREIQPWVFQQTNGLSDTVIFQPSGTQMTMFIGNRPYQAYQKTAWDETPAFHFGLLLICLVLFLGTVVSAPVHLIGAIRRKSNGEAKGSPFRSDFPRWLGWSTSMLNVIVLIGFFLLFSSEDPFAVQFAISPALVAAMMLASISALLTVGVVFWGFVAWRMYSWSRWRCLSYMLPAVAGVAFSVDLNFWHLLWLP
jgi:hypothetical protein